MSTSGNTLSQDVRPLTGKRVFVYFLLFFLVMTSVNVYMASLAINTRTGLITDHPYEKGLEYNKLVKAADDQASLHWKAEITFTSGDLNFSLQDENGHPVKITSAEVQFTRPIQAGMDFTVSMQQAAGQQHYHAKVSVPAKGLWEARIFAVAQGKHFQQAKRIVIE